MTVSRRLWWAFGLAAALIAVGLALRPEPVPVEAGRAEYGALQVTIDEDGMTRLHDRFVVDAPVSGRLHRIELHPGDSVAAGAEVARLDPLPLDPRERRELEARLAAAQATQREADALIERADADHAQAQRDLERARKLAAEGVFSREQRELAERAETAAAKDLDAARFRARAAAAEVVAARARLLGAEQLSADGRRTVVLRSPEPGRVLRIPDQSARVVAAGTPLLELSHEPRLEVVVDVLSEDAVRISPGDPALLEDWGGEQPLRAQVRSVEPSGFTKISALGVEEQRVNVILDFVDPPGRLSDGYRVEARVIVWQGDHVLKAPYSALFREGDAWAVFVVEGGRARRRTVEVGHRTPLEAEILNGLRQGEAVILHPANEIADGTRVRVQ